MIEGVSASEVITFVVILIGIGCIYFFSGYGDY